MSGELSTVRRALEILRVLGDQSQQSPSGHGVAEVAEAVGREKSQVSRTLKLLAEEGFVERDPRTLGYRLGWQIFTLAASAGDTRLVDQAGPVLTELVRATEEQAHLCVLQAASAVTVRSERPRRAVETSDWVGRAAPLSCTSAGRALLMGRSREEIARLVGGELLGTRTAPKDLDDLVARVRRAQRRGYEVTVDEFETGLVGVGAPVHGPRGEVVAAVNVSAPRFRLPRRHIPTVAREVAAAAQTLSSRFRSSPPSP